MPLAISWECTQCQKENIDYPNRVPEKCPICGETIRILGGTEAQINYKVAYEGRIESEKETNIFRREKEKNVGVGVTNKTNDKRRCFGERKSMRNDSQKDITIFLIVYALWITVSALMCEITMNGLDELSCAWPVYAYGIVAPFVFFLSNRKVKGIGTGICIFFQAVLSVMDFSYLYIPYWDEIVLLTMSILFGGIMIVLQYKHVQK